MVVLTLFTLALGNTHCLFALQSVGAQGSLLYVGLHKFQEVMNMQLKLQFLRRNAYAVLEISQLSSSTVMLTKLITFTPTRRRISFLR